MSQSSTDVLLEGFRTAKNDSVFISQHSAEPFRVYQTDKTIKFDTTDALIKKLFVSEPGQVIGPFSKGNTRHYFKVLGFENAYRIHAGIIWIKYREGRSEQQMADLTNYIFTEVKNGKDFNAFCHLYSDDNNMRSNCDIGFVYNSKLPPPMNDDVIKHKTGDLFIVHTSYGYHIIKMLGDPVLEKIKVQFVKLSLK